MRQKLIRNNSFFMILVLKQEVLSIFSENLIEIPKDIEPLYVKFHGCDVNIIKCAGLHQTKRQK